MDNFAVVDVVNDPYTKKEGYTIIPGYPRWIRDPNGMEWKKVPFTEDIRKRILTDTDPEYCGVLLYNGDVNPRVEQAPKQPYLDWLETEHAKCGMKDGMFYESPNLSWSDDKKVQVVMAKESEPIVNITHDYALELTEQLGYGNVNSCMVYDGAYGYEYIYEAILEGNEGMINKFYVRLKNAKESNKSYRRARGTVSKFGVCGTRCTHITDALNYIYATRATLIRKSNLN